MSDFADRMRRNEHQANPYRGMRDYTAFTPIRKQTRGNVGSLNLETPWDESTSGGTYRPVAFMLDGHGFGHVVGPVAGGAEGTVICVLPPLLRPEFNYRVVQATGDPSVIAIVEVSSDGSVTLVGYR